MITPDAASGMIAVVKRRGDVERKPCGGPRSNKAFPPIAEAAPVNGGDELAD